MQDCIIEVERRIKRNKQRLDQNKDDETVVNPVQITMLDVLCVLLNVILIGDGRDCQPFVRTVHRNYKLTPRDRSTRGEG